MARFATALAIPFLAATSAAAQPKIIEIPPKGAAAAPTEAVLRLREEVELIEAQLETKKAYVKAAEVAVTAAEREYNLTAQAAGGGGTTVAAVEKAKSVLEAAKGQLDIRKAEANEVAVKLKHAKRRADAVAKPPAPAPAVPAEKLGRDVQLQLLTGLVDAATAQEKVAQAHLERAKAELDRAKRLFEVRAIAKADYDTAAAQADAAAANLKQAAAAASALRGALDLLKNAGNGGSSDRKQLEADVDRAEAALKLKRAEVEKAEAGLQKAKAGLERLIEAAKRGPVSQQDYDAARARVAEAEAAVKVAAAEAAVAEAVLKRSEQLLDEAGK
jgi:multidrug resistance efflux pump